MSFLAEIEGASQPLPLHPDRPAHTHMLSYQQHRLQQTNLSIQQQRQQDLMVQNQQLSRMLQTKDQNNKGKVEQLMQALLLCQLEVERMRNVLSHWDAERRKHAEELNNVEGTYRLKLQELKLALTQQFEESVRSLRQQNATDLANIKEIYAHRLAQITREMQSYEDGLAAREMELRSKESQLEISGVAAKELAAKLEMRDHQVLQLESRLSRREEEQQKDHEQFIKVRNQLLSELESSKTEENNHRSENQLLKQRHLSLQQTIDEQRANIIQLNQYNLRLQERLQHSQLQVLALKKEIEGFRSRKTQKGEGKRQSKDEQLSLGGNPPREESNKTKDIKMNEEGARMKQESDPQELNALRQRYEESRRELEHLVGQKENQQSRWRQRLDLLNDQLDSLNAEWIRKQREMGGLFRSLENGYIKKLQEQEEMLRERGKKVQQLEKENMEISVGIGDKAREVAELKMQLASKKR